MSSPALEGAIIFYSAWAYRLLESKTYSQLQEIAKVCDGYSNDNPLHLGLNALGKRFDITDDIKQVTPLQVLALMAVALDMMSKGQYIEKGGVLANAVRDGYNLYKAGV